MSTRSIKKGRKKKSIEFFILKSFEKIRKPFVLNEVRVLESLRHKQIITYQNWYETKNHFWIIYEYLSGGDLSNLIKQDNGLPEPMLRVIARMLIDGIQYIHSKNTLFYNFKPTNFVFDEYNTLKFVDFSCARFFQDKEEPQGCPMIYLAPELLSKKELPSIESDFWSLGVLLFELATGKAPFLGNTEAEITESIKNTKELFVPKYSADFSSLIRGMLHKTKSERFNWSSINNHPWNLVPAITPILSTVFDTNRGKSTERLGIINMSKYSEKTIFESEVKGKTSLATNNNREKSGVRNIAQKEDQNNTFLKLEKMSSLSNVSRNVSQEKKSSTIKLNTQQFQSNTSDLGSQNTKGNSGTSKGSSPNQTNDSGLLVQYQTQKTETSNTINSNIGIKKDPTVSALNRNEITKKPVNFLPVKSPKVEIDLKKSKFTKFDISKEQSHPTFISTLPTNTVRADPNSLKRRLTPSGIKNEQTGSAKNIVNKGMHNKNNSVITIASNYLAEDSQIIEEGKIDNFGIETLPSICFENEKQTFENLEERRKTPELSKQSRMPKENTIRKKASVSPFINLRSSWKQSNKELNQRMSNMTKELLEQRDISSIILNDSIQLIDLNSITGVNINLANSDNHDTDEKIKVYLSEIHRFLTSSATETQKLFIIYQLCENLSDEKLANFIANSQMLDFFIKQAKSVKTRQLKIGLSTLIGMILRHATMMSPSISELSIVSTLTDQLNDTNETVKQRALAAYGELLFYSSTQAESISKNSETLWSSCSILLKVLKTFKDTVSLCYAVKTIENITTKAPANGKAFANEESVNSLVYVLETTKDAYLKSLVLRCLDNILNMAPSILKITVKKRLVDMNFTLMLDKNTELATASICLLINLLSILDEKGIEGIEIQMQKILKPLSLLALNNDLVLKNDALRLILFIISRESVLFTNFCMETPLLQNLERCLKDLPENDDTNPEIINLNMTMDFFAEVLKKFVQLILQHARENLKKLALLKNNKEARVQIKMFSSKAQTESETTSVELSDSFDNLIRTLVQLFSVEFVLDLINSEEVLDIFGLISNVSLLFEVFPEETIGIILHLFEIFYKNDERLQKHAITLSKQVFWELVNSYYLESSSESKSMKFKIISDLFLLVYVGNHTIVPSNLFAKSIQFLIGNFNTPVAKINLSALQIFRVCLENNLISKNECNFKKVVKDIFEAVASNEDNGVNQNFFKVMFLILSLNPELLSDLYNNNIITIAVEYLLKFKGSSSLEEVAECLTLFIQLIYKKTKNDTLESKMAFYMDHFEEILKFGLGCVRQTLGSMQTIGLSLVFYVLSLSTNSFESLKIMVDRELDMQKIDFSVIVKMKDRANSASSKRVAKILKFLN